MREAVTLTAACTPPAGQSDVVGKVGQDAVVPIRFIS